jgi:hypothetical protein
LVGLIYFFTFLLFYAHQTAPYPVGQLLGIYDFRMGLAFFSGPFWCGRRRKEEKSRELAQLLKADRLDRLKMARSGAATFDDPAR